jgi:hypothetical protein
LLSLVWHEISVRIGLWSGRQCRVGAVVGGDALLEEPVEWLDAGGVFAAAEHLARWMSQAVISLACATCRPTDGPPAPPASG